MIYDVCPECGRDDGLSDNLTGTNRHLQQHCYYCCWKGDVREPEKRAISDVRWVSVFNGGNCYEIFDGYGQIYTRSPGFRSIDEARDELEKLLKRFNSMEGGGPWTGVLWPASVKVQGEIVR